MLAGDGAAAVGLLEGVAERALTEARADRPCGVP